MSALPLEREFLDWDRMGSTPAKEVAHNGYRFLSAIQDVSRETQILGVATVFLKMCKLWNVSPANVLQIVDNILYKNGHMAQFQAMEDYIRFEL